MAASVSVVSFEEVQSDWENLLPSCSTNTIFVTPWWQRAWLRHFGHDAELRILSLSDRGEALGIAPMLTRDGVVEFLGGRDLFDYHDFIVPRGREEAFFDALLDYVLSTDWRVLDLKSLPQDSPTLRHLPAAAKRRGFAVQVVEEDKAPVKLLPKSWEDYVNGLSKKRRHELRRKMRRFEAAGVSRQYVCEGREAVADRMQDFLRLHRASSPDKARFMDERRATFFLDIAGELEARGQFRLAVLELDGVRVATCISLDYADTYFLYNSGYDPNYASLSVGFVNKALAVKEAIEAGRSVFDFLRGIERYKYDLGAEDRSLYHVTLRR